MISNDRQNEKFDYTRATHEHIPEIVTLHKQISETIYKSNFQDLLLSLNYQEIANSNDYVAVAVCHDHVVGFCSLVADQRGELLRIATKGLFRIFHMPLSEWVHFLPCVYQKLTVEILGRKWQGHENDQYRHAVEARAIIVDPQHPPANIGTAIVRPCVEQTTKVGYPLLIARVADSNEASKHLFPKNNFQQVGMKVGEKKV